MSATSPPAGAMRADARRNRQRLIEAALAAFAEHGADDASLDQIARRAGVGIGTLYRRFPNRCALLEAVYVDEIQSVCDRAYGFHEQLGPFDALAAWMRSFVGYNVSKKSLAHELTSALGKDSEFFKACKMNVKDAGGLLLDTAKAAGTVRSDLELMDVMRLIGSISSMPGIEPEHAERMLDIVLAGIKPQS
jgi:AcrR family transcriptional regulator